VDEPTGFDKIAGSDFGRAQRARRARAGTARVNPTLSATKLKRVPRGPFLILKVRGVWTNPRGSTRRITENRGERFWTRAARLSLSQCLFQVSESASGHTHRPALPSTHR
jgi:hypothetical protein